MEGKVQDLTEKFFTKQLPNGMVLLGQQMAQVSSAAMTILTPAGASYPADGSEGAAAVACEWCFRGAGDKDTRQLNDALDFLGSQHHELVQSEHIVLAAAQLDRNLPEVLAIYGDILRRPKFDTETFEPCRALALQDLASLEDEPARKCNVLLRENFYPQPFGRSACGNAESLRAMSPDDVRGYISERFTPAGTVLAVAGNIDWDSFCEMAEEHFGDWAGDAGPEREVRPALSGVTHIQKDSAQTHIALAHRSVTLSGEQYYAARTAEMVLSGGMASRLFTEVREKRGLVYHVSTRYHSLKDHAGMFTYAGTTPAKAQETFDVTVGELRRLAEGISQDEMARAKIQLKSALIMQAESTEARSSALTHDWYHLGHLRSLTELAEAIDKVTIDDVMAYLEQYPASDFTVLIIGPETVDTAAMCE